MAGVTPVTVMPAMMPPMAVVPPMVPMAVMPMMMPADLGGDVLLGALLHRGGGTRVDQRRCLGTAERSRHDQKCEDGKQAQNFRSVHSCSPSLQGNHVSAVRLHCCNRSAAT